MKENEKILYTPEALVYHHRRDLFFGHFKQLKGYAWHRGYFVKRFGGNSLSLSYFIPSIFLLYTIFVPFALYFNLPQVLNTYIPAINKNVFLALLLFPHSFYALCLIGSWVSTLSPIKGFCKAIGIFLSHLTYGVFFIKGFITGFIKK